MQTHKCRAFLFEVVTHYHPIKGYQKGKAFLNISSFPCGAEAQQLLLNIKTPFKATKVKTFLNAVYTETIGQYFKAFGFKSFGITTIQEKSIYTMLSNKTFLQLICQSFEAEDNKNLLHPVYFLKK